jgi:hypothetical protein
MRVHDRQRTRNLPCLLEEVELYLRQEILFLSAVVTEIMKRVEMRTVNGFVVLFGPVGLVQCAKRPLAYAALDLMTTNTIRQYPG